MFLGWIRGTNKAFVNRKELAYQSAVDELSSKSGLTFTKYYENQTTFGGTYEYNDSDLTLTIPNTNICEYRIFIAELHVKYDSYTLVSSQSTGVVMRIKMNSDYDNTISLGSYQRVDMTFYELYVNYATTPYGSETSPSYSCMYLPSSYNNTGSFWQSFSNSGNMKIYVGTDTYNTRIRVSNGLISFICYGLL